jgi:phosphatidylinositol alpha-1,6-mannosyltransferase
VVLARSSTKPTIACELAIEPDRWGISLPEQPPVLGEVDFMLVALDGRQHSLGQQVILHVGRMNARQRHKGHEVLLLAFLEIVEKNPKTQLVLAGTGDDYAHLRGIAQRLPAQLQQAIFMPGFVSDEDLTRLYQHCSLFAMPSRAEGFGIVYLEAMRWAKPCIGSRVDAASCVIVDGETGFLVDDPQSPQEVAASINWLLAHPEKASAMGRSGYNLVRRQHLFPHFKERFFEALGG